MKLALALAAVLAVPAFASKPISVNVPVGHTASVDLPSSVSKVTIDDPKLVDVKKSGRRITIVGLAAGHTEATVKTSEGDLQVRIYVAADRHGMP